MWKEHTQHAKHGIMRQRSKVHCRQKGRNMLAKQSCWLWCRNVVCYSNIIRFCTATIATARQQVGNGAAIDAFWVIKWTQGIGMPVQMMTSRLHAFDVPWDDLRHRMASSVDRWFTAAGIQSIFLILFSSRNSTSISLHMQQASNDHQFGHHVTRQQLIATRKV